MAKLLTVGILSLVFAAPGWAQADKKYCCEGYAFIAGRSTTPATASAGAGGEIFVYHGLAAGGDVGTTLGNPDGKLTMSMGYVAYHFLCCRAKNKVEPFASLGVGYLVGDINTHGINYQDFFIAGPDRVFTSPSGGVTFWPKKRVGVRFEVRHYAYTVSNGALLNVAGPNGFTEFRVAFALR